MAYPNDVPCPTCGAPVGFGCRTTTGTKPRRTDNHKARAEDWYVWSAKRRALGPETQEAIDLFSDAAAFVRERAEPLGGQGWFDADIDLVNAIRGSFKGNHDTAPYDARWIAAISPTAGLSLALMFQTWSSAAAEHGIHRLEQMVGYHETLALADLILTEARAGRR